MLFQIAAPQGGQYPRFHHLWLVLHILKLYVNWYKYSILCLDIFCSLLFLKFTHLTACTNGFLKFTAI